MKYERKPIPTKYNGVQFRSKLEAQWAAFFDLVEWKYTYEPFEINGRLPDFSIQCDNDVVYKAKTILVEVKPGVYMTEAYMKQTISDYKEFPAHILFLTEQPFTTHSCGGALAIGLGWQYDFFDNPDTIPYELNIKMGYDIGSEYACYDNMIHYNEYRKGFLYVTGDFDKESIEEVRSLFKKAGNTVQFKTYSKKRFNGYPF